ncbi:MAG: hypothetical protein U0W24_10265 [Bacteroidales bacterium]
METIKYTIIKSRNQYDEYCTMLEKLIDNENAGVQDEVELLNLLISKWDMEHNSFADLDPVELIKALMNENNLKAVDLCGILILSKGSVSKILNYQKGLSKVTIRRLSDYFKVSQDLFNRPYKLINQVNKHFRNESLMNTKKEMKNTVSI